MSTVIKKGSLLPFLQRQAWDFDPTRGYLYRTEFKGASQAQMLALQQDYARAGIACRLTYEQGDTANLEVEDSTQQFTIDTWQIVGNVESRDVLSAPAVENLSQPVFDALIQHLNAGDKSKDAFADAALVPFVGTALQRLYVRKLNGQGEYRRGQYVLRHTTNAPNRWSVNIADFGIDQIYTPAKLLTEAQSGALWIYPLPGRMAYKIANIPAPTAVANYLWGWLKGASTETTAANNRVDITTEYVLEQWSTDVDYGGYPVF